MRRNVQFRHVLPICQTVLAAVLGGIGLWQRHQILDKPFWGGESLWYSTARFHIWPWPYKFAAASNLPAFLTSALVLMPIRAMSEWTELALWLLLVPPLWYLVGRRLDAESRTSRPWWFLLSFTVASIFCATFPFGYIDYIYLGALMWAAAAVLLGRVIGRESGSFIEEK